MLLRRYKYIVCLSPSEIQIESYKKLVKLTIYNYFYSLNYKYLSFYVHNLSTHHNHFVRCQKFYFDISKNIHLIARLYYIDYFNITLRYVILYIND